MITIRKSGQRGHADHGWLNSFHTFSFAGYYDPEHMGFGPLRVINEDRVAAGRGFGAHAHRDMEILSYVVKGKLAHKDSMGHHEELGPNEIQKMSAGTGVIHSEFNGSKDEPVYFFQIWIEPRTTGTDPAYEQIAFDPAEKKNKLKLLAAPERVEGAATINQDARFYVSELEEGKHLTHALAPGRKAWLQVVSGDLVVNGQQLSAGDAAALVDEASIDIAAKATGTSEVLLFDLA